MLAHADLESCIQECTRCHAMCVQTIQYCLKRAASMPPRIMSA